MGRCACERCVLVCAYVHGAACPRGGCRLSPSRPVRSVMAADLGFLLSCCSVVRLSSNSRRLRHWWMKWLSPGSTWQRATTNSSVRLSARFRFGFLCCVFSSARRWCCCFWIGTIRERKQPRVLFLIRGLFRPRGPTTPSLSWTRSGSSDTTTHAHGRYRSSRNLRQEQPHNTIRTTTVSRSKQHDHATAVATPRTAHTHARQRTAVGREVEGRNVVQRCFRRRPVTEDG